MTTVTHYFTLNWPAYDFPPVLPISSRLSVAICYKLCDPMPRARRTEAISGLIGRMLLTMKCQRLIRRLLFIMSTEFRQNVLLVFMLKMCIVQAEYEFVMEKTMWKMPLKGK